MLDRSVIEETMVAAAPPDPDDPAGIDDRNTLRREAVIDLLDSTSDLGPGMFGKSPKDMILDDLPSYRAWERG
jgi:hypothetical protein